MKVRKPAVALGSTAAGIAVVVGLHPAGGSLLGATRAPSIGASSPSASTPTATTRPAASASPSAGATTTTSPAATATTRPAAPAARASSPATGSGGAHSATGKPIQYGYGVMSVKATVTGAKLTDVTVVRLQVADPTSEQIAVQVDPMLRSQALKLQTWRINGISGATYTSEAYAYSLQSALTKLHFK